MTSLHHAEVVEQPAELGMPLRDRRELITQNTLDVRQGTVRIRELGRHLLEDHDASSEGEPLRR